MRIATMVVPMVKCKESSTVDKIYQENMDQHLMLIKWVTLRGKCHDE